VNAPDYFLFADHPDLVKDPRCSQSRIVAELESQRALMSRIGGWLTKRLYSRLNWLALS